MFTHLTVVFPGSLFCLSVTQCLNIKRVIEEQIGSLGRRRFGWKTSFLKSFVVLISEDA